MGLNMTLLMIKAVYRGHMSLKTNREVTIHRVKEM